MHCFMEQVTPIQLHFHLLIFVCEDEEMFPASRLNRKEMLIFLILVLHLNCESKA